ncbi:MAG: OstA-like protein [Ferruginibacter sp.]
MTIRFTITVLFTAFFFLFTGNVFAQQPVAAAPATDTVRYIRIVKAKNLREKTIDSVNTIETAAGDVVIIEGLTTTYCDSVVIQRPANIVEAFGNIHINDNDSIHTYSQYLKYIGGERVAYLKKSVKLTDKKGVLTADEIEYNLRTGIASYKNGGKVVNGKTTLTSKEGVYYSDTKDVYFKKNVHLVDPKYNIWTDSLLYNLNTDIATFIAPTHIVSKDGIIDTKSGTYNLKTGEAIFFERTYIRDSTHSIIGDKISSDEKTGIVTVDGNGKFVDSVNQVTVIGGRLEISRKENSFLAYKKPVMILHKDGDSTYIAADTLFSGLRKYDSLTQKQVVKKDTVSSTIIVKKDSLAIASKDSLNKGDSLQLTQAPKNDTIIKAAVINLNKTEKDTAIRYFLAFHHVRIFNDSLQAVSDSLYYATEDSTFMLFGEPVVWNGQSQVTGDTMYMYTQNQKPKLLYVFYNGLIINEPAKGLYNQVAGRTINGYFKDGSIDYVRVKGSPAESIYYPQDDDSAFVGMNRSSGDVIDIFFVNKELNKVKFIRAVEGMMYPLRQIPADRKQLKGFKWLDARRPKNKLELFE